MPYYTVSFVRSDTNDVVSFDFFSVGWLHELNDREKDPWYAATRLFGSICGATVLFTELTLGYNNTTCEGCKTGQAAQRSHMQIGGCLYVPPKGVHYMLVPYYSSHE